MQTVEPISRLVAALTRLPGIGEKTASRLALFILNSGDGYLNELGSSLRAVRDEVTICSVCQTFADSDPCPVCADDSRDRSLICVVADFKDMMAIEGTARYKGLYHILHGTLSPLKGVGPDDVRIRELMERVKAGGVKEIMLATGFDADGEATAIFLSGLLNERAIEGLKVTRIASGVPVGSFVEYMDGSTLERAIDGRSVLID